MRENMRRANPVEDLVHWSNSLFTTSINGHSLPLKFKMPSLDSNDGTRDPFDHIVTFKTTMHLQGVPDKIMCRAFLTTLKGPMQVRFSKIPPNTVSSFEKLSKLFVNNFIEGQRHKYSSSSLLTTEQRENERLWSFITHFNREALTMDEMDDKLLLATFHNGVNIDLFIHKLYEKEPQIMAELVHSAQNFMNAEQAIIARKRKRAERMEANLPHHSEQGPHPKKGWTSKKKRPRQQEGKLFSTKSTIYASKHVIGIGAYANQGWSFLEVARKKWREIPTNAIGINIASSREIMGMIRTSDLKQQIEDLIKQGKLRNFLERDHKDEKLNVLDTHLTQWNQSSKLWWPIFISYLPICQSIYMLNLMCVHVINPNSIY